MKHLSNKQIKGQFQRITLSENVLVEPIHSDLTFNNFTPTQFTCES